MTQNTTPATTPGFNLGPSTPTTTATPATTGLTFAQQPPATTANTGANTTTTAPATIQGGYNFTNPTNTTTPATTTTTAPSFYAANTTPSNTNNTGIKFAATPTPGGSSFLGSNPTTTTAAPGNTTSTPATNTASLTITPNLGALNNKSLDSIINRWVSHLEKQIHQFHQQANQVADWDKMLMSNAEQINLLNNEIEKMQSSQTDLEKKLDIIGTKQQDLNLRLKKLEAEVEKLDNVMPPPTTADKKREQSYELAQKLQQQLEAMKNGTLKDLIGKINSIQPVDEDNEVVQITQILNEHYNQLEWIESQYLKLTLKAKEVEKISKEQKLIAEKGTNKRF